MPSETIKRRLRSLDDVEDAKRIRIIMRTKDKLKKRVLAPVAARLVSRGGYEYVDGYAMEKEPPKINKMFNDTPSPTIDDIGLLDIQFAEKTPPKRPPQVIRTDRSVRKKTEIPVEVMESIRGINKASMDVPQDLLRTEREQTIRRIIDNARKKRPMKKENLNEKEKEASI